MSASLTKLKKIKELSRELARLKADVGDEPPAPAKKKKKPVAASPAADKTDLTVSEALRISDTQLFVLNTSGRVNPEGKRSDVLIDISMPNGANQLVTIPDTWMPSDITDTVPRKIALNSPMFRRAIQQGLIGIISTNAAERMLMGEDAAEERRRLRLRESQEVVTDADTIDDSDQALADVSPQVIDLMSRTMAPRDRLAALKNMADTLSDKDIHYIVVKATKAESKLLAWIETLRDKRVRRR